MAFLMPRMGGPSLTAGALASTSAPFLTSFSFYNPNIAVEGRVREALIDWIKHITDTTSGRVFVY